MLPYAVARSQVFDRSVFDPVLQMLDLDLSDAQVGHLMSHLTLLRRWNQVMNLTTIRDPRLVVERHFGESLFLATRLPETARNLVDIGSGAGFPGLPVGVVRPALAVSLVESAKKKAVFLREAARGLSNVTVIENRFECTEGQFDWATARAVAVPRVLEAAQSRVEWLALLTTVDQLPGLLEAEGVSWRSPEPLPWGQKRVLVVGKMFHVEHSVLD